MFDMVRLQIPTDSLPVSSPYLGILPFSTAACVKDREYSAIWIKVQHWD